MTAAGAASPAAAFSRVILRTQILSFLTVPRLTKDQVTLVCLP